ncbi:hypothetical protein OAK43_03355 [Verrucomicrobiales bacterium]|nr:hypothetical protein [Verrucomicrobiales bacterium]MDC0259252.1 hypothetical protein [Verrucomicrobiales bacterium]MDC0322215.1 hypothetical protein [Verrucomicrobiales bacterium]
MITSTFLAAMSILACPRCMSGADNNIAIAANSAIAVLFLILMAVLACFLTFIGYLAKRSKMAEEMVPVPVPVSEDQN